jgi:engulfment/cell motility protein 1
MQNSYSDGEQEAMLDYIWAAAKINEDSIDHYGEGSAKSRGKTNAKDVVKWRKIGFETEDLRREFEGTGMLGLECLVSIIAVS